MSSYKDLMARALREYPTLYPEPLDATIEFLCSNGNYAWSKHGELECRYSDDRKNPALMDYSDLDEDDARLAQDMAKGPSCLDSLNGSRKLAAKAERMRRELVDQNMDVIVAGDATATYFRAAFHASRSQQDLIQGKTTLGLDTRFLYFPDNLTPEWGEVVHDFHDWLLERMNNQFGVSASGLDRHWPEAAQLMKEKILLARERLHPLMHDGQTYAEHAEQSRLFAAQLIDEMLAEEAQVASTPRRPKP